MLALATVPKSVRPKPSKAEIIEALAILQYRKEAAERAEKKSIAERLLADAFNACFEFLRKNIDRVPKDFSLGGCYNSTVSGVKIEFEFFDKILPKEIKSLIVRAQQARDAVPRERPIDFIRNEIRKNMEKTVDQRALALIANPEMKKALDITLNALNGK